MGSPRGEAQSSRMTLDVSLQPLGTSYILRYWRLGEEEIQGEKSRVWFQTHEVWRAYSCLNASKSAWIPPEATLKVCIAEEAAVERLRRIRKRRQSMTRRGWSEAPGKLFQEEKGGQHFQCCWEVYGSRAGCVGFCLFVCLRYKGTRGCFWECSNKRDAKVEKIEGASPEGIKLSERKILFLCRLMFCPWEPVNQLTEYRLRRENLFMWELTKAVVPCWVKVTEKGWERKSLYRKKHGFL